MLAIKGSIILYSWNGLKSSLVLILKMHIFKQNLYLCRCKRLHQPKYSKLQYDWQVCHQTLYILKTADLVCTYCCYLINVPGIHRLGINISCTFQKTHFHTIFTNLHQTWSCPSSLKTHHRCITDDDKREANREI